MVADPRCAICGTTETLRYCGACKRYFCDRCRPNYPARAQGALAALLKWLGLA